MRGNLSDDKLKCTCGACVTCRKRESYRRIAAKKREQEQLIKPGEQFPRKHEVIVWECSDGSEFSNELDAAYHQMGIYKHVSTSNTKGGRQ